MLLHASMWPLILFGIIGALSAITLPFVFAGTPVCSPKVSSDALLFYHPPLQFSIGNLAQACYLIVNVLVIFAASEERDSGGGKSFWFSCYFLVGLVFIQFVFLIAGAHFPYSFLQTNPGYAMATVTSGAVSSRVVGTFTESSGAGLVLASFAGAVLARLFDGQGSAISLLFALSALAMVRSSSGIAAVALVALILLLGRPVIRWPWYIRLRRLNALLGMLVVSAGGIVLVLATPLRQSILAQTVNKSNSVSFFARTTRDLFSVQLAIHTFGLGVGLGSNRPSSLLASMVSNIGFLGLVVFLVMFFRILKNPGRHNSWAKYAAIALLLDMSLADPDINTAFLWVMLATLVQLGALRDASAPEKVPLYFITPPPERCMET
jgi:hypothetical protein